MVVPHLKDIQGYSTQLLKARLSLASSSYLMIIDIIYLLCYDRSSFSTIHLMGVTRIAGVKKWLLHLKNVPQLSLSG